MEQKKRTIKPYDWSINLEDSWFEQHPDELLQTAIEAVKSTSHEYYVNLVTPGNLGNPEKGFISNLTRRLLEENIAVKDIRYIAECGCGGHVTRVYR